ncbi:hypothetical protein HNR06_003299 [Nocardiopsis arvandica]|uniref:Uncharacterized protein n=1 Tax=Nocardiopsis sinuspersici TaxID=501010 RepID=A0A7Y9XFC5_9ACTN|nr:hypothetical protein [Nocardiopsis sinuspersici]NYH53710.1 hypothetical protein [Nocardiopsis sinuspersici]
MGLRERLGEWFGGRRETSPPAPERLRAQEEQRTLDAMHRQIDAVHAELLRMGDALSPEAARVVSAEPPRFATVEEARGHMRWIRAVLAKGLGG